MRCNTLRVPKLVTSLFLQEAMFRMQLQKAEEADKKVFLGCHVWIGQDVMSADAVAEAQQMRDDQHRRHQEYTELKAMKR